MTNETKAMLNSILKHDLTHFIHRCFQTVVPGETFLMNWHMRAIAWRLEQCLSGEIKRLIITLPPRSLKSICTSVALSAWALGRDPSLKIICASYSNELATKHARDFRAVMESSWYQKVFPRTRISREKNTEFEVMTTARGGRLATSVEGTLTGRGGNIIIIDDPMKPIDAASETRRQAVRDWFDHTLLSRLNNKNEDVIILIMQRLHEDDLAGHLLEKGGWTHLNLPAIAEVSDVIPIGDDLFYERAAGEALHPERESLETLEGIRRSLGTFNFSAQYQQNPIPLEGNLIRWEWFKTYSSFPEKGSNDQIVQSWDTASKAEEIHDYSVCTTWLRRGEDFYLLDVARKRMEYPALRKFITEHARLHEADAVLIEDRGSGTQLIQDLREEGVVKPIAISPEADKVTRMHVHSPRIEGGHVFLPEEAHWLGAFQSEVLQFPQVRHDDQVDSMSQFLGWAKIRRARLISSGGTRIFGGESGGFRRSSSLDSFP